MPDSTIPKIQPISIPKFTNSSNLEALQQKYKAEAQSRIAFDNLLSTGKSALHQFKPSSVLKEPYKQFVNSVEEHINTATNKYIDPYLTDIERNDIEVDGIRFLQEIYSQSASEGGFLKVAHDTGNAEKKFYTNNKDADPKRISQVEGLLSDGLNIISEEQGLVNEDGEWNNNAINLINKAYSTKIPEVADIPGFMTEIANEFAKHTIQSFNTTQGSPFGLNARAGSGIRAGAVVTTTHGGKKYSTSAIASNVIQASMGNQDILKSIKWDSKYEVGQDVLTVDMVNNIAGEVAEIIKKERKKQRGDKDIIQNGQLLIDSIIQAGGEAINNGVSLQQFKKIIDYGINIAGTYNLNDKTFKRVFSGLGGSGSGGGGGGKKRSDKVPVVPGTTTQHSNKYEDPGQYYERVHIDSQRNPATKEALRKAQDTTRGFLNEITNSDTTNSEVGILQGEMDNLLANVPYGKRPDVANNLWNALMLSYEVSNIQDYNHGKINELKDNILNNYDSRTANNIIKLLQNKSIKDASVGSGTIEQIVPSVFDLLNITDKENVNGIVNKMEEISEKIEQDEYDNYNSYSKDEYKTPVASIVLGSLSNEERKLLTTAILKAYSVESINKDGSPVDNTDLSEEEQEKIKTEGLDYIKRILSDTADKQGIGGLDNHLDIELISSEDGKYTWRMTTISGQEDDKGDRETKRFRVVTNTDNLYNTTNDLLKKSEQNTDIGHVANGDRLQRIQNDFIRQGVKAEVRKLLRDDIDRGKLNLNILGNEVKILREGDRAVILIKTNRYLIREYIDYNTVNQGVQAIMQKLGGAINTIMIP